jgi:hypothetical protein
MEALIRKEGTMKHGDRLVIAAAVILVLSFASVSHAETPYFPLGVGMEWKYAVTYDWIPTGDTVTVAVTGIQQVGGVDYYVLDGYFFGGFYVPDQHLVRAEGGKIWVREGNHEEILYDFENFPTCTGDPMYWWDHLILSTGDECYTDGRNGCPNGPPYWISPTRFSIDLCYLYTDSWWTEEFEEDIGLAERVVGWYMGWPEWHEYWYELVSVTEGSSVEERCWGEVKALLR